MWTGTERIEIAAPPEVVWAIVSDVRRHQEFHGSGEINEIRVNGPLGPGVTWEADETVKVAGSFTARSQCTVFDPGREFAWRSFPPPVSKRRPAESSADVRWSFTLNRTSAGTELVQTFTVVPPKVGGLRMRIFYLLTGRARTIRRGNAVTMTNIKSLVEREQAARAV